MVSLFKTKGSSFCKMCILFFNCSEVGNGSYEALGKLVPKPLTKLKYALEEFIKHDKNTLLIADIIMAILNKKQDNILVLLDNKQKDEIFRNHLKLKPIIQTFDCCHTQQIALRVLEDTDRISFDQP